MIINTRLFIKLPCQKIVRTTDTAGVHASLSNSVCSYVSITYKIKITTKTNNNKVQITNHLISAIVCKQDRNRQV